MKKKKDKLPGQGKPGLEEYSRALMNKPKQKMENAILEEIHDRLLQTVWLVHGKASSLKGVWFWTTVVARMRCLRISLRISETRERAKNPCFLLQSP